MEHASLELRAEQGAYGTWLPELTYSEEGQQSPSMHHSAVESAISGEPPSVTGTLARVTLFLADGLQRREHYRDPSPEMPRTSNKNKGGRKAKVPRRTGKTAKVVNNGQQGRTGSIAELTPLPESRADSHSIGSKKSLKATKNIIAPNSTKDKDGENHIRPRTRVQTQKRGPSIQQESSESESEWVRKEKVDGKRRRNSAESIESAEMRLATARSLNDMVLREGRVEDDRQFAAELQATMHQEEADREFALELEASENRKLDRRISKLSERTEIESDGRSQVSEHKEKRRRRHFSSSEEESTVNTCPFEVTEEVKVLDTIRSSTQKSRMPTPIRYESDGESSYESIYTPRHKQKRTVHGVKDRVILQKYRDADSKTNKSGSTRIPDQGIAWDKTGKPYEAAPPPSRGSSVGTKGGTVKEKMVRPVEPGRGSAKGIKRSATPWVRVEDGEAHRVHMNKRESQTASAKTGGRSRIMCTPAQMPDSPSSISSDTDTTESSTSSSDRETSNSDEESTDSAWDMDPDDLVSRLSAEQDGVKKERRTAGPSGIPPSDSSSSSETSESTEDATPRKAKKGAAKTPRKNPGESDRKHK
ncbi:hypothetical protein K438DRAFT_1779085 [Mycena galopus ATCC 62051]|nr:hypothetical protein K438DRAFT_1779085 [Mycena galopus ATCC 62051]